MDFAKYVKIRNEKFGAVVFDTLNEKVFVTNETGKEILGLMAEGLDVSGIAARLGESYGEQSSNIQPEITEFVDGLQSAGLLAPTEETE